MPQRASFLLACVEDGLGISHELWWGGSFCDGVHIHMFGNLLHNASEEDELVAPLLSSDC